jgi:hypothetical protein
MRLSTLCGLHRDTEQVKKIDENLPNLIYDENEPN